MARLLHHRSRRMGLGAAVASVMYGEEVGHSTKQG
jgi:hypothetical protein